MAFSIQDFVSQERATPPSATSGASIAGTNLEEYNQNGYKETVSLDKPDEVSGLLSRKLILKKFLKAPSVPHTGIFPPEVEAKAFDRMYQFAAHPEDRSKFNIYDFMSYDQLVEIIHKMLMFTVQRQAKELLDDIEKEEQRLREELILGLKKRLGMLEE